MAETIHVIIFNACVLVRWPIKVVVVVLVRAYAAIVIILSLDYRETSDRLLSAHHQPLKTFNF